jgi:hypothetical protein
MAAGGATRLRQLAGMAKLMENQQARQGAGWEFGANQEKFRCH